MELEISLKEEWLLICHQTYSNLIKSMPRRLEAVSWIIGLSLRLGGWPNHRKSGRKECWLLNHWEYWKSILPLSNRRLPTHPIMIITTSSSENATGASRPYFTSDRLTTGRKGISKSGWEGQSPQTWSGTESTQTYPDTSSYPLYHSSTPITSPIAPAMRVRHLYGLQPITRRSCGLMELYRAAVRMETRWWSNGLQNIRS